MYQQFDVNINTIGISLYNINDQISIPELGMFVYKPEIHFSLGDAAATVLCAK